MRNPLFLAIVLVVLSSIVVQAGIAAVPASVTINPADTTIVSGHNLQFTAVVKDSSGAAIDTAITWSATGGIGTIDSTGLFMAADSGDGYVIAAAGALTDSATVHIFWAVMDISPDSATVSVGDSVVFDVMFASSDSNIPMAPMVLTLTDTTAGYLSGAVFHAVQAGMTTVIASRATWADTATVTVIDTTSPPAAGTIGFITITPQDTGLSVGDSVQFSAVVRDTGGAILDTVVVWTLAGDPAGTLDSTGLLIASQAGSAVVIAALGGISDTATVSVTEDEAPPVSSGGNIVSFRRILSNGNDTKFGGDVTEGGTKTLGGMGSPMNFLNGGKLEFPENSLSDDITIYIKLPAFGTVMGNDVQFGDSILAAVTFEVHVGDSVIHPFVFDEPLRLTLPFKHGLLANLGITPQDLGMFFVTATGTLDSTGITDIQVDETGNTISALVHHFSDVAVAPRSAGTALREPVGISRRGGRIDAQGMPALQNMGLQNLFVNVPDGALTEQVQMRIQLATTVPEAKRALNAVDFTIDGHTGQFNFGQPVEIGIPYPDTVRQRERLTIRRWDPALGEWAPLELPNSIQVDTTARVVRCQVQHFTVYGVLEDEATTGIEDVTGIPDRFTLSANYPNPFNPETSIRYALPQAARVTIAVFNLLGQKVATLVDEQQSAGEYTVRWNGTDSHGVAAPSGLYFYRMETSAGFIQTRRMLLLK